MTPRDLFWRAISRCNYPHATAVLGEVWMQHAYLVGAKHSHASVVFIGIATFGPQNAAPGGGLGQRHRSPGSAELAPRRLHPHITSSPTGELHVH